MKKEITGEGAEKRVGDYEKKLVIATLIISVLCMLLIILQLFLPALKVGEQSSGNTYVYNTYNGIEVAFICWPAFIIGGELIGPNILLIAAIVLPILITFACSLMLIKAKAKKRMILCILMMLGFTFFAIAWLNLGTLVMNTAYSKFEEIVFYAKQNDMFGLHVYAIFTSIMCLLSALFNAVLAVVSSKKK